MSNISSSYINTLIFCVVCKVVMLVLLVTLITDVGWSFSYLILTVEIALVAIIAYTLYKIYAYQKEIDAAAQASTTAPSLLSTCPDYFVMSTTDESGDTICNSTYTTPDGKLTYIFNQSATGANIDQLNLTSILSNNKTMQSLCNSTTTPPMTYSWTDITSRCGTLDTFI